MRRAAKDNAKQSDANEDHSYWNGFADGVQALNRKLRANRIG
jgi:hypothetical protein